MTQGILLCRLQGAIHRGGKERDSYGSHYVVLDCCKEGRHKVARWHAVLEKVHPTHAQLFQQLQSKPPKGGTDPIDIRQGPFN